MRTRQAFAARAAVRSLLAVCRNKRKMPAYLQLFSRVSESIVVLSEDENHLARHRRRLRRCGNRSSGPAETGVWLLRSLHGVLPHFLPLSAGTRVRRWFYCCFSTCLYPARMLCIWRCETCKCARRVWTILCTSDISQAESFVRVLAAYALLALHFI